ncbi:MAG: lysylphosphatidylglycerol synthase transmembrane domain-containing protein [Geminicoccales bacterium]
MSRRAIQLRVSITLLGVLFWWIGIERLIAEAMAIRPQFALLALGMLLVQNDLTTRRWAAVLRAFEEPPGHLRMLRIQYMALFTQLFLPSSIGGAAVRVGVLLRSGYRFGVALNSVLIDRVVALGGLVLIATAFLPAIASSVRMEGDTGPFVAIAAALACIGCAIGAAIWWRPLSFWIGLIRRTPLRSLAEPLARAVPELIRPRTIIGAFAYSLGGQLAAIFAIFVLAMGKGLSVGLLDCILVMPPVMLLSALPISIAGWGVREGAMVIAFGLLGVAPGAALMLSVEFAIIGHLATTPGAIAWLMEVDRGAYGKMARSLNEPTRR